MIKISYTTNSRFKVL